MLGIPLFDGDATCIDHLDLVDAAFTRPGGPEAHELATAICPSCEVAAQCLAWAMRHGEYGTWGGATQRTRTNAGAPPARDGSR
jgi:hypothetical protein